MFQGQIIKFYGKFVPTAVPCF